jgi:hypothetical protein
MTSFFWTRKRLVLSVAIVILVAVAAAVSIALAYPEPVSSAALGPDWHCTRLAYMVTSCARIVRPQPASANLRKDSDCLRPTVLIQGQPNER